MEHLLLPVYLKNFKTVQIRFNSLTSLNQVNEETNYQLTVYFRPKKRETNKGKGVLF